MNGKNGKVPYEERKEAMKRHKRLRDRRRKAALKLPRELRYSKRHSHVDVAVDTANQPLPVPFGFFDPLPKHEPVRLVEISTSNGDSNEGEGFEELEELMELAEMTRLVELSPSLGFRATIRVAQ